MRSFAWSLTSFTIAIVATFVAVDECTALRLELDGAKVRIAELEAQVVRLRGELTRIEDARIEREREFLRFTKGISQLKSLALEPQPSFTPHVADARPKILDVSTDPLALQTSGQEPLEDATSTGAPSARAASSSPAVADGSPPASVASQGNAADAALPSPSPATSSSAALPDAATPITAGRTANEIAADARDRAIFFSLRMLLAAEQITSLDLLESGALHGDWVGPIVLRVLDDRGRPLGAIAADRMRLEGSRAARMITIVLENGYERRGGVKVAFEGSPVDATGRGGVRRIAIPECDPNPWIERVPELFVALERAELIDDGGRDLNALRSTLNELLKNEAESGWYRVQGIGGARGRVLRDVAIDRLDKDGHVERRYFADRMSIHREPLGLQLSLEGGSHVKRDQKTPFLDGRCRIFLPRANVAAWEKAQIPGLERSDETEPTPAK
ncbi:MAG: hypothetical protein SGI72_15055 [Planctomycetota bacterium]|nr:hypothetical protein [Planctomycetota bacterium]